MDNHEPPKNVSRSSDSPISTAPMHPGQCDRLAMLMRDHERFTAPGPEFETLDPHILDNLLFDCGEHRPLLLAFYLPQFHTFPENNRFWSPGFTEWHQLPRSLPRFPGHYQPRIPRDLGYYNLTMIDTFEAQISLALACGIGGFAFYYYRFDHGRVMDKPLELFLKSDLNMPFILIWANESWKRPRRDATSLDEWEVTLKQNYSPHDENDLLEDIARHLVDRRYISISGRPLFVIYRPKDIPDAPETIARWRSSLRSRYGINPLMFMAQTYGDNDPREYGLDGALEFPPHKLPPSNWHMSTSVAYSDTYKGRVCNYDDFARFFMEEPMPEFPLIKTAVPSWDNDPRYPNRGISLRGLSPRKYQDWLTALILRSIQQPILNKPIVAINAWNEWAECAYLEPDVYYGFSFLNATARAFRTSVGHAYAESRLSRHNSGSD